MLGQGRGASGKRHKRYQFLTNEKNRIMILMELLIMEYQARNPEKNTNKVYKVFDGIHRIRQQLVDMADVSLNYKCWKLLFPIGFNRIL